MNCYANPQLSGHVEKHRLFVFIVPYNDTWTWLVRLVKPNAKENGQLMSCGADGSH